MTLFSEKVIISNRRICGLMSNLIKKSWTDSNIHVLEGLKASQPSLVIPCSLLLNFTAGAPPSSLARGIAGVAASSAWRLTSSGVCLRGVCLRGVYRRPAAPPTVKCNVVAKATITHRQLTHQIATVVYTLPYFSYGVHTMYYYISMTSPLTHIVAHSTRPSFKPKTKN